MLLRSLRLALTSLLGLAAVVGGAAAAPPPLPEYGFRGMKRVEVVFVNVGRSGGSGGVATQKGSSPPELPADDLVSRDLAKDPECEAIGKTLSNAGLEIVALGRWPLMPLAAKWSTEPGASSELLPEQHEQ